MNDEKLSELPLIEHIRELRTRIIMSFIFFGIAFILCYTFRNELYNLITLPFDKALKLSHIPSKLIYTKLTEGFGATIKISTSFAMFFCIPFFAIQAWLFITPALYKEEKPSIISYILLTPMLFISGVIFCYFFVLPKVFKFLINFIDNSKLTSPIHLEAKISEYLELTLGFLNIFGLCFLTPILLILLVKFGIINRETLIKNGKYAIIIIFIISAILTPPDVISQTLLAIPLIFMYLISILLTKKFSNKV